MGVSFKWKPLDTNWDQMGHTIWDEMVLFHLEPIGIKWKAPFQTNWEVTNWKPSRYQLGTYHLVSNGKHHFSDQLGNYQLETISIPIGTKWDTPFGMKWFYSIWNQLGSNGKHHLKSNGIYFPLGNHFKTNWDQMENTISDQLGNYQLETISNGHKNH